jgi:hypothetical protein
MHVDIMVVVRVKCNPLLDEGFSKIHVAYDEEKRRRELKNLPRLLPRPFS